MSEKPNCYECKHRRDAGPWDSHSLCDHPKLGGEIQVKGNAHGIKHGWFNWPVNFDPVWLESCTGFERKDTQHESQDHAASESAETPVPKREESGCSLKTTTTS